jgi:hypothetical protein
MGLEGVTIEFPETLYRGHFLEDGYSGGGLCSNQHKPCSSSSNHMHRLQAMIFVSKALCTMHCHLCLGQPTNRVL